MYRTNIDYHNKVNNGKTPQVYVVVKTHYGSRAYADEALSDAFEIEDRIYDGKWSYDGAYNYGSGSTLTSKEARVLSYGRLTKELTPVYKDLLTGFGTKRQNRFTVVLNNADKAMSKLIATEPFITKPLDVYLGFEDIAFSEHQKIFSGVIDQLDISLTSLTIQAVES